MMVGPLCCISCVLVQSFDLSSIGSKNDSLDIDFGQVSDFMHSQFISMINTEVSEAPSILSCFTIVRDFLRFEGLPRNG